MEELNSPVGTDTLLQDNLTEIQRELQNVPYDESSAYNQDVAPIGGTQVFNLYAVDNLENRIPILKTVVIRTATLTEIIDALLKSDEFAEFFEQTLLDGQWLRYSTEPPYILDEFKPNTLYFNVANIEVGTSSPGPIDGPSDWATASKARAKLSVPTKVTLTCLVDGTPYYVPINKGTTWEQIRSTLNEPDRTQFPMMKFTHWSLTENGAEIPDLKTFDASSVIYAVFTDNSVIVRVNGVKYPFKTQIGTKFSQFKPRISLSTKRKVVGYSLSYKGELIPDDYQITEAIMIYPQFEG